MNLGPSLGCKPLDTLRHVLSLDLLSGCAVEFGVASGTTTRLIADRMPTIGFDSFRGLPEWWRDGFGVGAFRDQYPRYLDNITLVEGWFDQTLPSWSPPEPVSLVHVDCDLYSSTSTVFEHVDRWLSAGVVVVFDEFHGWPMAGVIPGEAEAWDEYVERTGREWEPIGHGPEQFAVRLLS